jgi:hypothetical protein
MRPSQMKIFKANEELANMMHQDGFVRVAPCVYTDPKTGLFHPTDEDGAYFRKGFETIDEAVQARLKHLKR